MSHVRLLEIYMHTSRHELDSYDNDIAHIIYVMSYNIYSVGIYYSRLDMFYAELRKLYNANKK